MQSAETILGELETSEEEDEVCVSIYYEIVIFYLQLVSENHIDFSTQLDELISWTQEICTMDTCGDIVNNFNYENEE